MVRHCVPRLTPTGEPLLAGYADRGRNLTASNRGRNRSPNEPGIGTRRHNLRRSGRRSGADGRAQIESICPVQAAL